MLGSFTGMLAKLKESKTVQSIAVNISHNYSKLKGQVFHQCIITQILPQLYHCSFPEPDTVANLKAHIGNSEFQIWNVSQYGYDESVQKALLGSEQGEVHHLCLPMYSNLPFYEMVLSLSTIHRFLQASPHNRVYVHCQDSRIRSALLLACYIYKHREGVEDISEAILLINRLLRVQLEEPDSKMHNNIHILLRNFVNYLNDYHSINRHQLRLLKVLFSNVPHLEVDGKIINDPRICIEVRRGEELVAKKIVEWEAVEGEMLGVGFEGKGPLLSDQLLLVVKYISAGRAYNIMRVQLNTNFIYDCFTRVQEQEIDTSDFALLSEAFTHIDFIFQSTENLSKLASLEHSGLSGNLEQEPKRITEKKKQEKQNAQKEVEKASIEEKKEEIRTKKEEAAQVEREQAHEEAMAQLQEAVQEIVDQDSTTIDLAEEITQKISLTLASKPQQNDPNKQEEEEDEQDLDDYLSKLESQA